MTNSSNVELLFQQLQNVGYLASGKIIEDDNINILQSHATKKSLMYKKKNSEFAAPSYLPSYTKDSYCPIP